MDHEEDLLDSLLAVATEELDKLDEGENSKKHQPNEQTFPTNQSTSSKSNLKSQSSKKELIETDIFQFESNLKLPLHKKFHSEIHNGDTDSSDDEGNRNYEDQKYNQYGREVKNLLNNSHNSAIEANSISSNHYGVPKKRISTWKNNSNNVASNAGSTPQNNKQSLGKLPEVEKKFQDVFMDPIFGMRIVNPLISSALLLEKMQGRLAVRYSDLSRHIFAGNLKDRDWVICGVVVSKSPPKTSNKGSQYSIWTLSDLKDDIKTFSVFLFSSGHKDLWKTTIGTVIGILNPSVMDQKEGSKNEISLSVSNAQKIMIFGQSKDFGICKSMKKNGDKCTAVVNLSRCEYCIYHIKQEYQKCSKRSELQANFAGKGLLNLRNKVLGKNEVFYAGKSYMAIPAKKSKKLEARDQNILQNLSGMNVGSIKTKNVPKNRTRVARQLDVNPAQRAKDLKLLEKLGGSTNIETKTNFSGQRSDEVTLEDSKATALSVINKLKAQKEKLEEHVNKKCQYNIKSDLFVNVENKNTFSGNISEVSLEESKNIALNAISKLKAKSTKIINNESKKSIDKEDGLLLAEIEDYLNSEDLNYSEDENIPVSSKPSSITNNVTDNNVFSIKENSKSINSDFAKKAQAFHTPKSVKSNESFGKISPKLSETEFNPNNLKESRKLVSTPKSTSTECYKKHNSSRTSSTLKPNNLSRSFSNFVEIESSVISTNIGDFNEHSNNAQVSSGLNANLSSAIDNCKNPSKTTLSRKLDIDNMIMGIPMLSSAGKGDLIDLSKPVRQRHVDRAKLNALKFVQRNGPIKKVDPNSTKSSGSKKRNIESVLDLYNDSINANANNVNGTTAKKSKLQESEFISDRFKKMMAMTSKYAGLLEQHDDEEKEKYFKKLEVKEQMEEKMTNTHKVKCKAVRCLQCKYTSFSASELCKNDRHPLKVFDAMKRFYKCSNCQNRTVTLELVPTRPCNNCGSSKWEKTGMMKEKIALVQHNLSIRGGEQKFVNSVIQDANLDLLVPDD